MGILRGEIVKSDIAKEANKQVKNPNDKSKMGFISAKPVKSNIKCEACGV